jgi:hypothetical protein
MLQNGLKYQTIEVDRRGPMQTGVSPKGSAVGARFKLLKKGLKILNNMGLSLQVKQAILHLKPDILRRIAREEKKFKQTLPDLGALIVVGIASGDRKKFIDSPGRMFINAHIGGIGRNPLTVFSSYQTRPHLVAGASKDWIRYDHFIWVTRDVL